MEIIDFTNIEYLLSGNNRQQSAYTVLRSIRIMELLEAYHPVLAGTIPLGIDVAGSDLDILCYSPDPDLFSLVLRQHFGGFEGFSLHSFQTPQGLAITATFQAGGFPIEVFGQVIPSQEQVAFRHMLIEYRLLQELGPAFRQEVIALKATGLKTEPAFAQLLQLNGDPYQALLELL